MNRTILETRVARMNLATLASETRDDFVSKHLGLDAASVVSDSDLIHRSVTLKKNVSAFTVGRDTVLMLIQEALYEYMDDIIDWLGDYSDGADLCAYLDCNQPIGKGFYKKPWHSWNAGPCNCSVVKVVLRKTDDTKEFRIVTVYPEPSEADKIACYDASERYEKMHPQKGVKGRAKLYTTPVTPSV